MIRGIERDYCLYRSEFTSASGHWDTLDEEHDFWAGSWKTERL